MKSLASMGCAANKPPFTGRITPDIQSDLSLAKKTAAIATSQGVPSVPRGGLPAFFVHHVQVSSAQ